MKHSIYREIKDTKAQSSAPFNQYILDRIIRKIVNKKFQGTPKVLDAGCGIGNNLNTLSKYYNLACLVFFVILSPGMIIDYFK